MADDEIKSRFSLDTKEALDKLTGIHSSILEIGAPKNLLGLIQGLASANKGILAVGASLYALNKSMDLVFEAEQIKSINAQFEILGKNAGVATDILRDGLVEASRGLIDDTDLINTANRALVTMGEGAAKLPQILELARKSAALFGKDTNEQFESLVQAIESGNQRSLRRLGIMVDVKKAEEDYARTLGISANALNEHGKQQAILNAVLEKGGKSFSDVDESIKGATNAWKEIKITTQAVYESFVLVFDKAFGPLVTKFLQSVSEAARGVKTLFEKPPENKVGKMTAAQVKELGNLQTSLQELEEKKDAMDVSQYQAQWAVLTRDIKAFESGINKINKENAPKKSKKEDSIDRSAQLADEAKFLADKNKLYAEDERLKDQTIAEEVIADSERDIQELILLNAHLQAIEAIKLQYSTRENERDELLFLEEELYQTRLVELAQNSADQIDALKLKSFDNQIKATDDFLTKVELGLKRSTTKAGIEYKKFENVGVAAAGGIANGFTTAFSHIADGNFDLARDMKKAIIGALADEAQARGALLIASSIWPPNPLGLAAGAGLVGLSGVLRSLAGGEGGPSVSASSGGGGGGATNYNPSQFGPATDNRQVLNDAEAERERKQVSIVIQGNYFETEQTRQRLVEIIRDSADYSDFKVQSVGGGL